MTTASRAASFRLVLLLALAVAAVAPAAATAADPSLKAAYGFEEGSGSTVGDASATGNTGTIAGASWTTAGRFGSALSFDGVDDMVNVPDSDSLDFSTAMTLEAWVRPTEMTRYRPAIIKDAPSSLAYALYSEVSSARPRFQVQMAGKLRGVDGPTQLPVNTWTHLAATYDGVEFRLYANGTQIAVSGRRGVVTATTGQLHIGGTLVEPENFKGQIDEVRLYNRALTAGEIQLDMNTQVAGGPDTSPPTTPLNFLSTGAGPTSISTSWTASTDDRGVDAYHMYVNGQPAGTTNLTSFTFAGLTCGTQYTLGVEAWDAAQNKSARTSLTASTGACDSTPPTVAVTAPAAGAEVSGTISVTANASDNDQVAGVQFLLDDQPLGSEDTTAPYSAPWNTRSSTNGPHVLKARARDRAGLTRTSAGVTVTVENTTAEPPPGLVAAYGFDEGSGTTVADASGNENNGTIAGGAAWTATGRIGAALNFDGSDDQVSVADASSLDLTTGMTLSAWVRPDTLNGAWRTVIFKHRTGGLAYALYAQEGLARPLGELYTGSGATLPGPAQLPLAAWTHLAYTYDGANQRLFVNGTQVAGAPRSGTLVNGTGLLTIGRNPQWGEAFDGLIDEVRVYNRALPQAEIESDMNTSVSTPDAQDPTAPTNLAATGSVGRVSLTWTASTDDVGVSNYNVHRATTPGFTPTAGNRIAQPTTTSYADAGLTAGTYYYKVTAQDRANKLSPPSNEASGTALADTVLPTVSVTSPAAGATVSGIVEVTANAADNESVAGVQFRLDGQNLGAEDTSAPYSLSWNSRLATNGAHVLSARARDASGNTRTSTDVPVTVDNSFTPPPGLVAGYGFDEAGGGTVTDSSGTGNAGTISGATRVPIGRFGGALDFDGSNDWVTVPDSSSLDVSSGLTMSAWVRPDVLGTPWRTVLMKETTGNDIYAIYANTSTGQVPSGEIAFANGKVAINGQTKVPDGAWTHLAVTYDGAAVRLYVNGAQVSTVARSSTVVSSTGALRIGGNAPWGEYFDGLIDEVRVYNRGLTAAEIDADMRLGVARDTTAPTVTAVSPAAGATGEGVGPAVTATFSEAMDPATITASTFVLRDSSNAVVPATVTYNESTGKATLRSVGALRYGTQYTATVEGGTSGDRAKDRAGNALAADRVWSFTTEPEPPPILVLTSAGNPFTTYVSEVLRAEGINAFYTADVSLVDAAFLSNFDVVVLGEIPLTAAQAGVFSSWVGGGGNLIALRPDKDLAGLLGLTDAGTTLSNAYLRVNTGTAPGAGIVGDSIQFHGTADRYTLNGATAVATLWSNATTATGNPAVALRNVGTSGGQAAAFTYDLAQSVSLTRQGNPAWAGQNRDGLSPARTNDLFYGGAQPNWVDLGKIHIPQADEQQRLLANLITEMNRDRTPVPRFWYLPRDEKAAVVMTGDDHNEGGTVGRFNQYKAASPAGCSPAEWECVRSSSYIYVPSPITNAQVAQFEADGFEVALHPTTGGCGNPDFNEYNELYSEQLAEFSAFYTNAPAPTTSRFHCVSWSDWSSHARVEVLNGVRMDTNYYHYPPSWGAFPGFMTGSGEIMKFAELDGTTIDLYQAHTHLNDEGMDEEDLGQVGTAVNSLLNWATGPLGYYGLFTANMHTDDVDSDGSDAIVASAQARGVPIISARQALRWVEGRDDSSFREFSWSGGRLGFTVTVGSGANGLRGMLPVQSSAGPLTSLTRDGSPVTLTSQTIKGVQYGFFNATAGRYEARYGS